MGKLRRPPCSAAIRRRGAGSGSTNEVSGGVRLTNLRGVASCWSGVRRLLAVAPVAELVHESRMGGRPIKLGPSLGGGRPLIEQQDFGEGVTQACSRLLVGTRNRARRVGCDGRRLGEFRDGRVQSIADDVVTAGGVVLQDAPEEIREVGDVDRGPVLTSG